MFHGSMVALVTPMNGDGSLDQDGLQKLIEFHIANATDAIVSVGTTGESATLNEKEHCEVIRQTVEMVNGRIPVIAGTGANSTTEAIFLTKCALSAGADAALLVTPYYNKPPQEGLYQHYKAIAGAVAIPQILYNVPGRTACDMLPETVERLSHISNIIGIKEATGSVQRCREILARCGDRIEVLSGDDATAMELILSGAKGNISVTANIVPRAMHDMCVAALAGDRMTAEKINKQLIPLNEALFTESSPIPVKWAVHRMGYISTGIRLPLTPLPSQLQETVLQAMQKSGVKV